jgi:hypothetical protein
MSKEYTWILMDQSNITDIRIKLKMKIKYIKQIKTKQNNFMSLQEMGRTFNI